RLLRHARSLVKKGCILAGIKSGATQAGSRAAASHTGAMATSDIFVAALFDKAGILRVNSREALIDIVCVVKAAKGRIRGKRVCIVTDAGGPGVMLADELTRGGMELPSLSPATLGKLQEILPKESSLMNPIDALPSRTAAQIGAIIEVLNADERHNLDAVAVLTGDSGLSDNSEIYQRIGREMQRSSIPVLPMLSSLTSCREKIAEFVQAGNTYFPYEVALGTALAKVASWQEPEEYSGSPRDYHKEEIDRALQNHQGALEPATVARILKAAGIPQPPQAEVFSEDQLENGCKQVGYPLVMKVIGPLHKTDVGGVRLGIENDASARAAWAEMMTIDGAEGVLLQPMIGGQEVIVGASREDQFGHLIMFGLGGIHAEVLKDARFALAPLTENEAMRLIDGIRSRPLLDGVRGAPGMNVAILAEIIQRMGQLVTDFPQIGEIDLNPVKGTGDNLWAVDARIIVSPTGDL
ncbi:MAG: acetate--CoA ligase family protein, partial [Desulfopila sp.]